MARAVAARRARPEPSSRSEWRPHPGPQERFLRLRVDEALYGGSAGGGKSFALLLGACRFVAEPGYRALLLRRTFPELTRYLVDRSRPLYSALGGVYNETKHLWRFPSGAVVEFGSLEHESSKHAYQSAEYQYVGFDELTSFTLGQYLYLRSRLRSTGGLPCLLRSATNPGGAGHAWVLERWAPWLYPPDCDDYHGQRAAPGEVLWSARDEDDVERYVQRVDGATSRTFIPARLADNPSLASDRTYAARLKSLCRLERRQLLDGDWLAEPAAGELFRRAWFRVVQAAPTETRVRVRYWDRAASTSGDWTVGVRMHEFDGLYHVVDVVRARGGPRDVAALLRQTAVIDGQGVTQVLEQDPGQAGVVESAHLVSELAGHDVHVLRPTGDKVTRAKPASAQAEAGNIVVVRGAWTDAFLRELEAFPDGDYDDQVDALSGAFAWCASRARSPRPGTSGRSEIRARPGGY